MENESVRLYILPGGKTPERQTDGAIGYDAYLRAIVSATEMDKDSPHLRRTLFDFETIPKIPNVKRHVHKKEGQLVYRMDPGESVLAGIGFVTEMTFPMFYWVAPRSGLASKHGITVTNAPGTVDPDYRGEAGVLIYNRNNHCFDLTRGMRIAQIIFQKALIHEFALVEDVGCLVRSGRGSGGFGSTGI